MSCDNFRSVWSEFQTERAARLKALSPSSVRAMEQEEHHMDRRQNDYLFFGDMNINRKDLNQEEFHR